MAVRSRRTKNFWEPFYNPATPDNFQDHDWLFNNETGPTYRVFDALKAPLVNFLKIENVLFTFCDFSGVFEKSIVFKDCKFSNCDFGLSTFKNVKFTRCEFKLTSFTQTTITNSEFRDCKFNKIGISGNATDLSG